MMDTQETPKREIKKEKFRLAVFRNPRSVCRQEIAQVTGLNPRTIASYAAHYKKAGLLTEKAVPEGKGRPTVYYESNLDNVVFVGATLVYEKIYLVLLDVNRYVIGARTIQMDSWHDATAEFVRHALGGLDELLATCPGKPLAGAGFCLNEYRQDAKYAKSFRELFQAAGRKYGAHTVFANADTVNLNHIRNLFKLDGNLAIVGPSDEISLGLILEGRTVANPEPWRRKFAHGPVVEGGTICYCGQQGCLDCYLTHAAITRRYCEKTGRRKAGFDIYDFRMLLKENDPVCLEMARENGVMLGKALARLSAELHFSRIYLSHADEVTAEAARESFRRQGGGEGAVIEPCWHSLAHICVGAAEMPIDEIL